MFENNNFSYCHSCQNKKICFEHNWCITMDKNGKRCDNYIINPKIKEILEEK